MRLTIHKFTSGALDTSHLSTTFENCFRKVVPKYIVTCSGLYMYQYPSSTQKAQEGGAGIMSIDI